MNKTELKARLKRLGVEFDDKASASELTVLLDRHDKVIYHAAKKHCVSIPKMTIEGPVTHKVYKMLMQLNERYWSEHVTERRKSDK